MDGWKDLQRQLLRCVGEPATRFAEDYLRVLRGLRFAGRYELEIEPATWDALVAAASRLPRLSGERVREEILKVLSGPVPSRGLDLYRRSGALTVLVPEFTSIVDSDWRVILGTIDGLTESRVRLRLATLLAPAGPEIEPLMRRLRFSNAELRDVQVLSRGLDMPLPKADDIVACRRWLREVGPEDARDALRLNFRREEAQGTGAAGRAALAEQARAVLGVLRRGDPVTLGALAIDGNDLKEQGLRPGPEFGRVLEACLDAVIEDPALNEKDRLLEFARGITGD
jgi:tRNA nucleotidyltransferase (CCA-adding enzyme)